MVRPYGEAPHRSFYTFKVSLLFAIQLLFVYVNYFIPQVYFADTDTYLYYIDSIYYFREADWWIAEGLSKAVMIFLRGASSTTEQAIQFYRYILIALFSFSMYFTYKRSSWQTLIIALSLYAPLLGLITMRATPAYFLAVLAVNYAVQGRWIFIAFILGGFLFHVSTALAIPAAIIAFTLKKYNIVRIKPIYIFFFATSASAIIGFLSAFGGEFLVNIFSSFSYLSKYTVYVAGAGDVGSAVAEGPKLVHYIFAGFIIILSTFMIMKSREDQGVQSAFIAVSLIVYIYLFMTASSVASLRYSAFFILPALSWSDGLFRGQLQSVTSIGVLFGSLVVFAAGLQQVIYFG